MNIDWETVARQHEDTIRNLNRLLNQQREELQQAEKDRDDWKAKCLTAEGNRSGYSDAFSYMGGNPYTNTSSGYSQAEQNWQQAYWAEELRKASEKWRTGGRPPFADSAGHSNKDYTTLGVRPNATQAEIKAAYLKKAQEFHPDKGGDQKKMADLNAAYDRVKVKTA